MKKILSILLLCVMCLASCGGAETKTEYKTDVSVNDISAKIIEVSKNETLIQAEADWIVLNTPFDPSLCDEYSIYISTTSSSDMFGVFKASTEENADIIADEAKNYLEDLKNNWMSEYNQDEFPKVENAIVKKCGLYITFFIFEDEIRENA